MSAKMLNISGFKSCGAYQKAKNALSGISAIFPTRFSVNIHEHETRDEYMKWLDGFRGSIGAESHATSPIVWFDGGKFLGGRDDTLAWCRSMLSAPESTDGDTGDSWRANVDTWNPDHGFDYDLVVIGGGSGGLACSKEAVAHGAKVAVLDFVKPSPAGSKWGLGGTCVNVGCIPKKLMHQAALLGEAAKDAKGYGWQGLNTDAKTHSWEVLRDNTQDHIKGLNFGYRVQLREKKVQYLNKLGRFTGPHEMELTDAKGRKQTITSARFVIATGGRPSPLSIPGAELAITSDDIFMLEKPPGKTCVIGAGYVALECAGFITVLNNDDPERKVTVLCRSVPLRTFDRDTVKFIQDYMIHQGTQILEGVQPRSIEKLENGRLLVRYGSGSSSRDDVAEEFDTVLQAIGRTPDLSGLDLPALVGSSSAADGGDGNLRGTSSTTSAQGSGTGTAEGLLLHAKSGKIVTTNEQTSVPHVYAIGDVVHGCPELTPVAILAGKLLARRLFGNAAFHAAAEASREDLTISYKDIPTAVFTPLELGTVGLTEAEAAERYGEDAIDCYVSGFKPLEWTLTENHADLSSYAKIVIHKEQNQKVLGLHIACPNAGEIIQGFGLALKKGLHYKELASMIGIHPTVGEEFTVMAVTKSSGASVVKTGC